MTAEATSPRRNGPLPANSIEIVGYLSSPSTQTTESKPLEDSQVEASQANNPPAQGFSLCHGGCVDVALVEYGTSVYMLLFNTSTKRWIMRDIMSQRPREFIVYVGDVSVEVMHDDVLDKDVYVFRRGRNVIYDFGINDLIKKLLNNDRNIVNTSYFEPFMRVLIREARTRSGHVIGGFYPEGFDEGLVPYPARSWECEPRALVDIAKYIVQTYPSANRDFALANVALAIAKVYSPAVRFTGRTFEDRIVLNIGKKRIGKSNLIKSIVNLLGLRYNVVVKATDDAIKTPERFRNLLMDSNAPLFLDDIGPKGFEAMANIILTAMVDGSVIATQAQRYGYGIAYEFINLRSVVINTNLEAGTVARLLSQFGNTAWTRRAIVLNWAGTTLRPGVEPYQGKSILGCLRELWENADFRQFIIEKTNNVVDVAVAVMDALHRAYNIDTSIYIRAVKAVTEFAESVEDVVESRHSPEYQVIARLYDITRRDLGATNISVYHVIKHMVENPARFDIKVTGSREQEAVERDLREWEDLVKSLGFNPESLTASLNDGVFERLSDTEKALAYVWWLITSRKNRVIIYAGSSDGAYPGWARELFGARLNRYSNRYGYSVSWVELLKHMLNAGSETEKPTEATKSTGETTVDLNKQ